MSKTSAGERLAVLEGKLDAAHSRMDRVEGDIAAQLKDISSDVKELMGWMNRGKAWASIGVLASGIIGAAIMKIFGIK